MTKKINTYIFPPAMKILLCDHLRIFSCLVFCFLSAEAQQGPSVNIIPPSPNVASLGKYGDIPVSYYTGTPNISIPIYEVVDGDVSLPVSISYHASGIKVAEEASRVGLGWALNAGGVISRTVLGLDDFAEVPYSYHNKDAPELPLGGQYVFPIPGYIQECDLTFVNSSFSMPSEYIEADPPGFPYDFEPDQYFFNFAGSSGKFILKQNKDAILYKQEKMQITCINDTNSGWVVITEDGTKYTFDTYETYRNNGELFGTHRSAWYLNKIESPAGNMIELFYQNLGPQYIKPVGAFSEQQVSNTFGNTEDQTDLPTAFQQMVPGKEYETVVLDYIDFSNGQVKFIYDSRNDVDGDVKLDTVQIFKKLPNGNPESAPFKEYIFSYEYFTSTNDQDFDESNAYATKRLKLLSVTEKGTKDGTNQTKPPHEFTYNEGSSFTNLPAKTSFARDHWGYFNGKTGNSSLIPNYQIFQSPNPVDFYIGQMGQERDAGALYTAAFSLKNIKYPTGGSSEFEYEAHDIDPELSKSRDQSYFRDIPVFYNEVAKHMFYDGQDRGTVYEQVLDLTDEYVDGQGNYTNTTLSAAFRVESDCNSISGVPDVYFELYNEQGGRISKVTLGEAVYCDPGGSSVFTYQNEYTLAPGLYTWKAFITAASDGDPFEDISATYTYRAQIFPNGVTEKFLNVGGIRVSKITDNDGNNSDNDIVRTFNYHYKEDKDGDGTEEEYSYGLLMSRPRYSHFVVVYGPQSGQESTHLLRTSESNIPLNGSASGSIVGYSQVTVFQGENGEFGKRTFQYENQPDLILPYQSIVPNLSNPAPVAPLKPPSRSTMAYEKNGLLLEEHSYKKVGSGYQVIEETINDYTTFPNEEYVVYGMERRPLAGQLLGSNCPTFVGDVLYIYPALNPSFIRLISSTSRTYDQNDPSKLVEIVNHYFYDNSDHLQMTNQQTIRSDGKILETKYKYPLDYSTASAVIDTMISRHMHNQVIEQVQLVNNLEVTATGTEYQYTSDLVVPFKIHQYQTNQPGDGFSESPNGTTFSNYHERLNFGRYDDKGNLLQHNKKDGVVTSFIWGYHQTLPVAQVVNASFSEIEGLSGFGNDFHAGSGGLSSTQEEDLRDGLPNAQITTYTYDPLVGILTITDPLEQTTTYEYDHFNRLQWITDHQGNIVKKFEYEYDSDGAQ